MQFNFLVKVQGGASSSRSCLSKRRFSHFLTPPKRLSLSEISTLPPALAPTLQKICLRGASWRRHRLRPLQKSDTSLRSVLRQRVVIKGGGGTQHFFKSQSLYRGRAQNFSSPRA